MRIRPLVILAGLTCVAAVSAQELADIPYDGTWTATITAGDGTRQASRLVLREFAGTWYGKTGSTEHAKAGCSGRKFPVTVQESNASELAFTVWGSAVGPACRDLTIELKPVADKVLEGTVESLGTIKLVRR